MKRIKAVIAWISALRPARVVIQFSERHGFLLAAGLSFQLIFAVFAGIWVGFASAGLILRANPQISDAVFTTLARSVPGLIAWDGNEGVVDPAQLLQVEILGWTGAIAAVGLLFTAISWLSSARDAVRALFDLPGERTNFLLLKLRDSGLAVAFGIAIIVSSALSVFSTQALDVALGWLPFDGRSVVSTAVGRIVGLTLMLALDTLVLAILYRVLSGLRIPAQRLFAGALLGGAALGVVKILGGLLLGGAGRNPLLAGFAVIIGLLIWFNLICVIILMGASWIAVGMADAGLAADPKIAAERREQERREREAAEAARATLAAQQRGWFGRLFHRRQRTVDPHDSTERGQDDAVAPQHVRTPR